MGGFRASVKAPDGGERKIEFTYWTRAGVTIEAGRRALVVMVLQQRQRPVPFRNSVPVIESIYASSAVVAPGDVAILEVKAYDPDGDELHYAWAPADLLEPNHEARTRFHPVDEGEQEITITVADEKGGERSITLNLTVSATAEGEASVQLRLNHHPVVRGLYASTGRAQPLETITLTADVRDFDGDPLTFRWFDDCGGRFELSSRRNPKWTAPSAAPPSMQCRFRLAARDNRSGYGYGLLTLPVGPPEEVHYGPRLGVTFQSADRLFPGQRASLMISAEDPAGLALTFAWQASAGQLNVVHEDGGRSEATLAIPFDAESGDRFIVEAAAINTQDHRVVHRFVIEVE